MSTPFPASGTEDLQAAVEQVAVVAGKHVARTDADASFPTAALDAMRQSGLLGLLVPVEHGGLGGDLRSLIDTSIRLGRVDMSVAMIFAMHCQQVAALVNHGSDKLRQELLPEVAAGRLYLASVTTETGKGGHLLSAATPLGQRDGELVLDRLAPIVTGGDHADGFLITMRSPDAQSPHEVSLVYAHRHQLEVSGSGEWDPLGMRASHSVALHLAGRLPDHQIVGRNGDFRSISIQTFAPLAHLGWSACWLGTAAGALSRTVKMLRQSRKTAERDPLGSEFLLGRLAGARERLDSVHALLSHSCRTVETSSDLSTPRIQLLLNSLKITASEECYRAVDTLVDAVGMRHGYLRGSPTRLEQALRDLRSTTLNYHNDRLRLADGRLVFLDPEVTFA